MKTTTSLIIFMACLSVYLPGQDIVDDVYFRPSDAHKTSQREAVQSTRPNYKNGAKEIIYLDSRKNNELLITADSLYLLGEINDSIAETANANEYYNEEEGHYLNDFQGSSSDYEYAERIRRFHNPKFTIHISDPQYTDIYFLDDYNWNVYVDGSYAWVTPTYSNPYWNNYFWSPYSYSSMYWRNSWYGSPWGFGGYGGYGGWGGYYGGYGGYGGYYGGWGGYYGHGYGGYYGGGYGGYYGGYYNPYWGGGNYRSGISSRNKNYSEATRREDNNNRGASSRGNVNTTRISGSSYSPSVTRSSVNRATRVNRNDNNPGVVNRASNAPSRSTEGNSNAVRVNPSRSSSVISGVNTRPRTTNTIDSRVIERSAVTAPVRNSGAASSRDAGTTVRGSATSTAPSTTRSTSAPNRNSSSTVRYGTGTSAVRSSSSSSSGSGSSTYSVPSSTRSSSSTPSYSTPSRSSSTPSYSAPSSSSSRSSSSSSGSSSRSSGGSSSGGRR